MKLPKRLTRRPLLDAVFELRFEPANAAVGNLLPGLLFQRLGSVYSKWEQLPMASVPREILEKEPKLRFQAHHRMAGTNRRLDVGQRVVDLGFGDPYPGWEAMRNDVVQLLDVLPETKLIKSVQRLSLRYINIIPTTNEQQLSALNVRINVLGEPAPELGLRLRMEIVRDKYTTVVQIQAGTTATHFDGKKIAGILVDVDTLRPIGSEEDFWETKEMLINEAHQVLKETFFSLLTQETIESMGPEWGGGND